MRADSGRRTEKQALRPSHGAYSALCPSPGTTKYAACQHTPAAALHTTHVPTLTQYHRRARVFSTRFLACHTHFSFLAMTSVLLPQSLSRNARLFVAPPHRSPLAPSRACVFEHRDGAGTGEIGASVAWSVLGRCRLAETSMTSSAERASYAQSVRPAPHTGLSLYSFSRCCQNRLGSSPPSTRTRRRQAGRKPIMCASFAHPVSYRLSALTAGHDPVPTRCEVRRAQVCFVGSSNQRQEPRRLGFMCVGGMSRG